MNNNININNNGNFDDDEYGFGVFFNLEDLKVDHNGNVENWEEVYIMKLDPNGGILGRYDRFGKEIPMDIDADEIWEMRHGNLDDESVSKAIDELYRLLEPHYVEVCTSRQTYWQPAEYIIVGLSDEEA